MSEETFANLRLEPRGPVLHVILARPEVHDAFDDRSVGELTQAFARATQASGVRAVLLRSEGKSFCAGADLGWMRRMADNSDDENLRDAKALDGLFRAISRCSRPVVARVQGAALGGGAGLVAAADVVVAADTALLGFTEVRLGILPAVIAPYVLRKVPPGRAQALFLTGERFDASRARDLGLVHVVVPPDELDAAVDAVLAELLRGSTEAQGAVKRLVADVEGRTLEEARAVTTEAIARARASEDGREGMAAFLEKRRPRWAADAE